MRAGNGGAEGGSGRCGERLSGDPGWPGTSGERLLRRRERRTNERAIYQSNPFNHVEYHYTTQGSRHPAAGQARSDGRGGAAGCALCGFAAGFRGRNPQAAGQGGRSGEGRHAVVLQQGRRARALHVAGRRRGGRHRPRREAQGACRNGEARRRAELRGVRLSRSGFGYARRDRGRAAEQRPVAHDRAAPLRHHRRCVADAESDLRLGVRYGAAGSRLQLRAPRGAAEPPERLRRAAPPDRRQGAPLGAGRCGGRDVLAAGRRAPHVPGQAPGGQRGGADPPYRPDQQGRSRLDGQHPGCGHHRPPVQHGACRPDAHDRRGRLGSRASRLCADDRRGPRRCALGRQPQAAERGRPRAHHLGQRAHGHEDRDGRLLGLLCQPADRDSGGRQIRTFRLGDAAPGEILRVARLLLVALPEESLQTGYPHERRRTSVRRNGTLRKVSPDGHLSDVSAESLLSGRHRQDGELGHLRSCRRRFRPVRSGRPLEDRDPADHPRRY